MSVIVEDRFAELTPFVDAVRQAYRGRLHGAFLFGSRARGDNREDSDYDVAVVLDDEKATLWREQDVLADLAYETLHRQGVHIQPMVFRSTEWRADADGRELVRSARHGSIELTGAA